MLSPFDEQEEWIKILEILSSCNSGLAAGEESNLVVEVQREFQNRIGESPCAVSLYPSASKLAALYYYLHVY